MYHMYKRIVEINGEYIDLKIYITVVFLPLNSQIFWMQFMGENYFLHLILDAIVMEIFSLDSSFLIQHQITIIITAVSASQSSSLSKWELCNLSLTVMQDKLQSHNNAGVLHKNQLHSSGPSIDEDCIKT